MKTLQTYIKIDNILSFIEAHIELEYELRHMCNGGDIIQENDGTFKLQIELAKALHKMIYGKHASKFEFDKKDFKNIDNIFFNKIVVNKIDGKNSGYVPNSKLSSSSKFDCITLNIDEDSFGTKLFKVLAHELMHAWQDYKMKLKDMSLKTLSSADMYKQITSDKNEKITGIFLCKRILYLINKYEFGAYLSEIVSEFKDNLKHTTSYKDAIDKIKQDTVFAEYIAFKDALQYVNDNNIIDTNNETVTSNIHKYYNEISDKHKTYTELYKYLMQSLNECIIKLTKKLSNAYFEFIENQNIDEDCLVSSEYNRGLSKWVLYLLNSTRK